MKIRRIGELSLKECEGLLNSSADNKAFNIHQQYEVLKERRLNPLFVEKSKFLELNPQYRKGWFNRNKLDFYDVEDTVCDFKIVRAVVQKMGIYHFLANSIDRILDIKYDGIMNLGEGTYLLALGEKKGIVNILSEKIVWLYKMSKCDISYENDIITVKEKGQVIKRITNRGFKVID